MSTGDHDLYVRPVLIDMPGQLEPGHTSAQIDIGKEQGNAFKPLFQQLDRLFPIHSVVASEAGTIQNVARFHEDESVVVYDKGIRVSGWRHGTLTESKSGSFRRHGMAIRNGEMEVHYARHCSHLFATNQTKMWEPMRGHR